MNEKGSDHWAKERTRSGSVIMGSPPLGYRHTLSPMSAPSQRKYSTSHADPEICGCDKKP
jgi:hypothetical protein